MPALASFAIFQFLWVWNDYLIAFIFVGEQKAVMTYRLLRLLGQYGEGWRDVLNGRFDADGEIPCQIDGGLKCFGHPIGASGLRMIYENYLQLQGRAGERQRSKQPVFGLSHNLGGMPNQNVSAVAIVGLEGA